MVATWGKQEDIDPSAILKMPLPKFKLVTQIMVLEITEVFKEAIKILEGALAGFDLSRAKTVDVREEYAKMGIKLGVRKFWHTFEEADGSSSSPLLPPQLVRSTVDLRFSISY